MKSMAPGKLYETGAMVKPRDTDPLLLRMEGTGRGRERYHRLTAQDRRADHAAKTGPRTTSLKERR
jgi:hypothetical protein